MSGEDFDGLYVILGDVTSGNAPTLYNPKTTSEVLNFRYAITDTNEVIYSIVSEENHRNKKKEALEHFVNVTQDEITKKVGEEARKGIDAVEKEIENVKEELSELQKKHDTLKIEIASA